MLTNKANDLLIGTRAHGLLIYKNNSLKKINSPDHNIKKISDIVQGHNRIFFATNIGVFELSPNQNLEKIKGEPLKIIENKKINAIEILSTEVIAIAQSHAIYLFNAQRNSIEKVPFDEKYSIHDIYQDNLSTLWIATSKGIIRYDWKSKKTLPVPELIDASRILSIDQYQQYLWIASIDGGVYQVDLHSLETTQHTKRNDHTHSLSDQNIMSLFITKNGILWAGGFSSGLNALNLNLLAFNFETHINNSIHCAKDLNVFSLDKDKQGNIWIGTSRGLVIWNQLAQKCQLINQVTEQGTKNFTVYDTTIDNHLIWISSSIGLLVYDSTTERMTSLNHGLEDTVVFFSHKRAHQHMLIGTSQGLYDYNYSTATYKKIKVAEEKYGHISYRSYIVDKNNHFLFPTPQGVLQLTTDTPINKFTAVNNAFVNKEILAMAVNEHNELFISVWQSGLYHLSANHKIINHYFDQQVSESPLQIIPEKHSKNVWLSGYNGIISLDTTTKNVSLYSSQAGENYLALTQSSFHDNNHIYFGGNNGLIRFDPKVIETPEPLTPLMFTDLYLMNKAVLINDSTGTNFTLTTPIEKTEHLQFSHTDKVIGFEFIQLNFDDPTGVSYRYKLQPVSSQWTPLSNNNRRLTFTNLKSGHYQLDIESIYFNNKSHQSISFVVKVAPWLSWWALIIYTLIGLMLIYLYIKRKIAIEQKINVYLNQQVKQKTKKVEELMARKNEIFSNVSHEFRTPLTLILGPIEELRNAEKESANNESLAMISRNAKQLLNLVNQMLKLAQINEIDKTHKQLVAVSSRLNMIIEPFTYLAKKNSMHLTVQPIQDIKLLLTEDALEVICSNFLSNAIKYSFAGDDITIGSQIINDRFEVYVQDNGPGIHKKDHDKIFKRFKRLHQGQTQGVGIGLALVKEVADLNQAQLNVTSEIGQGAKFSVSFAIDPSLQDISDPHNFSKLTTETARAPAPTTTQTVLIIDDNSDMRNYINKILSQHFNCIMAVDGLDGIAQALKHVPDLIVCDVMMPKIDGFQVCRQLRGELITSHIPLVLLTALDEKTSRIKGWRENIDRYLNKPFDAQELILQIKNILNTHQLMQTTTIKAKDHGNIPYLSTVDQAFIDKLDAIIEKGFADPLFNLEKMASLMLVSDRQLQRKTTALINKSPNDFLREVRLKKATKLLIDGKQVSFISDVCGFSSLSYFSYSFKKHYGMTPKAYQKLNHTHKSTKK